jgi:hypothetical protein
MTGYVLEERDSIPGKSKLFLLSVSRPALGPMSRIVELYFHSPYVFLAKYFID